MRINRLSSLILIVSLLAGLLVPASGWSGAQPTHAATLTVNSLSDNASSCATSGVVCLREAIGSASGGDTIQFSVTGTIVLSRGVLTIGKNLTISGPGPGTLAIDGNYASRVFYINTGLTVSISGLTIRNGDVASSNGGGIYSAGILTISNSTFSTNLANAFGSGSAGNGGGIDNDHGTLTVSNSTFVGNSATASGIQSFGGAGGGIDNDHGTLTVSNSTFTNNSATASGIGGVGGGGIANDGRTSGNATLNVANSTFSANSAPDSYGGGIANNGTNGGNATLNIANSTFAGNTSTYGAGGGLDNDGSVGSATLNVTNSTFVANASYSFGGIYNNVLIGGGNAKVTLKNSILRHAASSPNCANSIGMTLTNDLVDDISCNNFINPVTNMAASLANNGGPTQTFALLAGSNAIGGVTDCTYPTGFPSGSIFDGGAGTPVIHDQRGVARKNPCDVGAYEMPFNPPTYVDTIGLYTQVGAQFYLRNSNSAGNADFIFSHGPASNVFTPLAGDWIGQGKTTIGLYDPATTAFYLRNSNSAGNADFAFQYGPMGVIPIVGDWTGQGKKTIGVYDPATGNFALRNSNSSGLADIFFRYGPPNAGLTPIVGDWTNKGYDSVGLYNQANAFFYLKNCNAAICASGDTVFQYGPATSNGGAPATPVIGHWVSGNPATIGVYVPADAYWYLRNTNTAGSADNQFQYGPGPNAGWLPVIGHWGTPGTIAQPLPATPVPTTLNGTLGFISNRDGQWSIYRLDGDEKHIQPLAAIGKNLIQSRPAWSADGKRIAFVSDKSGNPEIYVMNADGSNIHRLTYTHASNYQPAWSPDGKWIVFASNRDNTLNLYVMNADGNNVQQLTHGLGVASEQPVWSPDGKSIVYATGTGTLNIAIMNVSGSKTQRLTENGSQPIWSPDGKQIAFVSTRDGNAQLYVMNTDGSNTRRLTNDKAQDEMPTWSPDGKQIAFVSTRDGNAQLYVMNTDGSNIQRLTTNTAQDQLPIWLPR